MATSAGVKVVLVIFGVVAAAAVLEKLAGGGSEGIKTSESYRAQPPQPNAPAVSSAQVVPPGPAAALPIGANRVTIAETFPYVEFSEDKLADGRVSFKGMSADKGTIIEIIGPARSPTSVSVVAGIANDNDDFTRRNLARSLLMVTLTTGESKACSDWYLAALKRIGSGERTTLCAGRRIKVSGLPGAGMIVTTVSAP